MFVSVAVPFRTHNAVPYSQDRSVLIDCQFRLRAGCEACSNGQAGELVTVHTNEALGLLKDLGLVRNDNVLSGTMRLILESFVLGIVLYGPLMWF